MVIASATDYEAYGHNALNRETLRDLPGAAANDVYSAYDLAGRRQSARFASAGGQGVIYAYDTAGRLASETATLGTSRALAYQYDAASNRTRITWPDGVFAQYTYDALNRVDLVQENGANLLADYAYDPLSRRASVTRGNWTVSTYSYDSASRLTGLTQDLSGAANDQTYGFSYTAASQIAQRTAANDNYNWTGPNVTRTYNRNGLNQYTSVSGTSFTYDTRGNLTSDGSRTFAYDLENRLLSVSGSANLALSYDPLGRLRSTTAAGATTDFLYDGDRLVAEYNSSGAIVRRYVHGPGVDEPLVWYEGSGLTDRRWLAADHLGSIIATNDNVGTTTIQSYGPYGEPLNWAGLRFRYTGQMALPEAQLYHYRARVYDPSLGRFLQTDPIGYQDDFSLYAYVGSDPLNHVDPTGLSDLNLFNPASGQFAAAEAFDAPGFFTITGHGGTRGLRDDRTATQGPMLNAERLLRAARDAGLQSGQRILLAACNCATDQFAQRLANLTGSIVYAANGYVMYPSTNDPDLTDDIDAYRPGNRFTLRVAGVRTGGGEERGFVRFTPGGEDLPLLKYAASVSIHAQEWRPFDLPRKREQGSDVL